MNEYGSPSVNNESKIRNEDTKQVNTIMILLFFPMQHNYDSIDKFSFKLFSFSFHKVKLFVMKITSGSLMEKYSFLRYFHLTF